MKNQCDCECCKRACTEKPGWFLPGEAEKVAEYLDITLKELFDDYLAVDWFEGENGADDIFLLAPAVKGEETGDMYPGDPRGTCVFFEDGKCAIHDVKPFECAQYHHDEKRSVLSSRHDGVPNKWVEHQKQIEDLLGKEPYSREFFEGFGFLGLI
jgi:Fe-S-cluster containining protein